MDFQNQTLVQNQKCKLTGIDFQNTVSGVSDSIRRYGITDGEYVAVQMQSGIEYFVAVFALANVGAIPVLIPTRLRSEQIQNILDQYNIPVVLKALPPYTEGKKSLRHDLHESEIVLFTSGTNTVPKAVVLTFQNFIENALGSNKNIPFGPGDHWLVNLPLYHVGGISVFFRALVGGGCAYFSSINDPAISHISMVHTQLFRYIQNPFQTYFKAVLLGGSSFPNALVDSAAQAGLPIYRSYGMTEMASQITTTQMGLDLDTSGRLLASRELKIVNGEILVRGKTLFKGFLDQATSPFDADGWYHTHDLGHFQRENLIVTGRKDRMFVCGGENIQPETIEKILLNYPGVFQTRVISIPDPEYGYVPLAYVEAEKFNSNHLQDYLKERLSGLHIPKEILPFSQLPENLKTSKDL